jgi:Glycosyl hydrolases family 16
MSGESTPDILDRSRYVLEVEDTFARPSLDERLWIPHYLPHWTTPQASAARYVAGDGRLVLRIDRDQPAWSPEYTGELRVSSLQTGVFAGALGSDIGQHRFRDGLAVRTTQTSAATYTPVYGLIEIRARFSDDPASMAALWMIGFEDAPERSAEICIAEIFGRDVGSDVVGIGMGVHPFHDPSIQDEFSVEPVAIDAREPHWYAAIWAPNRIGFYVDDRLIKVVDQSPDYPMQVMLDIFEFRESDASRRPGPYPKTFVVEAFRGYRQ